jgi:hypothetical protein
MWGWRPLKRDLVALAIAIVTFVLIPASGADEELIWKMEMEFTDQFSMLPIPGFGSEMSLDGEIPDLSTAADVGELARGQRLFIEDLLPLRPDSESGDEGVERYRVANFSIELPSGWNASTEGDRYDGNLTLEGACSLVRIGWFDDSGIDPEEVLRQVIRAYRSDYLRFSILTAEAGESVTIGDEMASSLNIYYVYGGLELQKRIIAWSSFVSGRFFYASFWSCPESFDENLKKFERVCESFKDEGSERYVELEPRPVTLDGWGTVLSETIASRHFAKVAAQQSSGVEVKVSMKSHREGVQVIQLASEEMVSPTRRGGDPPREGAILKLLQDEGYEVSLLRKGGAYWVVVLGPEGRWQAISSAASETEREIGTLISPDDEEWYRGLVVDGPEETAGEEGEGSSFETVIEKDCDPPREAHFDPVAEVNLTWILRLEDLLELYSYSQEESDPGFFHEAQVCWALLKREGYDAWLVTGYEGHPLSQKMWVVVSHPGEGHLAVKPTAAGDGGGLGVIVTDAERFNGVAYETSLQYSCLHPDRGLAIDPGMIRAPAPV